MSHHTTAALATLGAVLGLSTIAPAHAMQCQAQSPAHTVAVAELYTSEGCNSCPPADKWFSALAAEGFDSSKVVQLGLHVDYWDYIGWKDEFANPAFTDRQKDWSGAHRSRTIYTPQLVLDGKDFRNYGQFAAWVAQTNKRPAEADIKLSFEEGDGAKPGTKSLMLKANAQLKAPASGASLYVALTQNKLVTPVKRGENAGVTLKHDHVVRQWFGPFALGADGKLAWSRALNLPASAFAQDAKQPMQAVAFVQQGPKLLQAVKLGPC
jgi:hypothetical protein